jgi:exodeoxyribonuclease VII small subunit
MADADDIAGLSFEGALKALEEIVAKLEGGKVELAESIKIYERGEALRKHCEAKLAEAEARIEKITLDPSGKPKGTAPLDVD